MSTVVILVISMALLAQACALELLRRRLVEHDELLLDLKFELATANHPARRALQAEWLARGGDEL